MSEIKVNSIKGVGASAAAITVNNSDGTCTANITNRSNRNIIINGAMQVAQRGTSSTSTGVQTVDRIVTYIDNIGVTPTYSQVDVTSGGAYNAGFRKAFQVTKGVGTANAASQLQVTYRIEAQDLAKSGWNYTDTNSFITFSFWVKSSISNHNPQVLIMDYDSSTSSTKYFVIDVPALTANTWTKITQKIPGHADQVYNNDTGIGMEIQILPWYGTNYTDAGNTTGAWTSFGTKPINSTWLTTNNSTFQVTGLQLEVGSVATDFEHRSFAVEKTLCERYYQNSFTTGQYPTSHTDISNRIVTTSWSDGNAPFPQFRTEMRAAPSITLRNYDSATTGQVNNNGTLRSASAANIGSKGAAYIAVTSGTGGGYTSFTYEANAEL
tara:strand:+ start:1099 stop:2241 length:1143 start_codon:yes stop_codon:yes gene_type:complete